MSAFGTSRAVAAVGIVLVTVACGDSASTAAPPGTTSEVTPPPAPLSMSRTTTVPAASALTRCTTAALRVSLGQGEGAAGHFYVPVLFTNTGNACGITGYPGVSYFAGSDEHQVGAAAIRDPGPVPRVVLQQGQSASAWVDEVNADNYDPAECDPTPVTGLRVYPPGDTQAVLLPQPGARACAQEMPGQRTLAVRAVQSDTGAP
ncbi:DUF4232 domain-containing protein [Amycolatopsis sp. NPDC004378]